MAFFSVKKFFLALFVLTLLSFFVPSTMVALGGLVPVRVGDTWRFAGVAMWRALVKGYKKKWTGSPAHKVYLVLITPFIIAFAVVRAALIVPLAILSWVLFASILAYERTLPIRVWLFRPLVGRIPEPRKFSVAETWNTLTSWSGSELYNQPLSQDDYATAEGSEGGSYTEVPISPQEADITLDPGQSHHTSGEPGSNVSPCGWNEGGDGAITPTASSSSTPIHVGIRRLGRVLKKPSKLSEAMSE